MLEKDAIREAIHCKDQFVSHLFLVPQKDGGQRPVVKPKELNTFIPYKHFKMEGLHLFKKIVEQGDYLRKLDLKCTYQTNSQRNSTSQMGGFPLRIPLSVFGLGPVPRLFTK